MRTHWDRRQSFQYLENRWKTKNGFWAALGELNYFNETGKFTQCYSPETARELWSVGLIADLLLELELDQTIKDSLIELVKSAYSSDGLCVSFSQPCPLPPDVDATALCTIILLRAGQIDSSLATKIASQIAANVNEKEIIKVWFTSSGPFDNVIDISICVSGLYLIYMLNHENLAKKTEDFIYNSLIQNKWDEYFFYYASYDHLLYMLTRIAAVSPAFRNRFQEVLEMRIKDRFGKTSNPLSVAQRVIAASNLGIKNPVDVATLCDTQHQDGSWAEDVIFQYTQPDGVTYVHGSKEITTAFAIKALSTIESQDIL